MSLKNLAKKRIGEILIEEGFLEPKDLEKGLEIQKKKGGLIGSILVRMGCVSEENLVAALSRQLSIPFMKLSNYNVNRNAQKLITKEIAERYLFFSFDEDEASISFAMADPLNQEALDAIEKRIPLRVQVFLSTPAEIKEAIDLYYGQTSIETKELKGR